MNMYLTNIFVCVIMLLAAVAAWAITTVWNRYIRPWIEMRNLTEAAKVVVNAVETLLGRYTGPEKWALALEKMENEYDFDIDNEIVLDALRSAWKQLDLSQLVAGEKTIIEEDDADA